MTPTDIPCSVVETAETDQNKGGAQVGNRNRYRHGLYSSRLPSFKGNTYIGRQTKEYRRKLEDAVQGRHGAVSEWHATVIAAVMEWVKHGLWASTESANHYDKLSHEQRLAYRREVPKAFGEAVKLLKSIGLDKEPQFNPYAFLHQPPTAN